ncbi:methyltransferase [Octadecabacter sp. 1_MG-2023]|uniref:tRNA1(Val) (adenine(37)-N6)-methyltransferase n=1 Tax=unclassified Octadecabacter TaxID=196158 RepID=UPI001C082D92|nr:MULTISPECIES: methyltransferase [unclassified Octadecabacter]MBU2994141.1 methyltransferase [Octadecabacter sp. B2R22]MDO6734570.1 methyltransferase [Octadecabacter sp. 1_MG-2023]
MNSDADTTHDAFLGGLLMLEQPAKGYRAGVDPVLMASAVQAQAGQSVLELGCGAGAAILCLATRVAGLHLHAVEVQARYADLCRANAAANGFDAQIWTADVGALPHDLTALTFDHVIANPPYLDRKSGKHSELIDRDIAFGGDTDTKIWIETATRRLKPKGWLTLIHKADRLPELMRAMDDRLGSLSVIPITGREGRPADRIIVHARKGGRTPFKLHAPVSLHVGPAHLTDGEDYRPEIAAILRTGAAFPFAD